MSAVSHGQQKQYMQDLQLEETQLSQWWTMCCWQQCVSAYLFCASVHKNIQCKTV